MNTVKVHQPQFRATLYKTVARKSLGGSAVTSDRFQGTVAQQAIDLTPFLGDGSHVTTHKSIRDPAGSWQIAIMDQPHTSTALESLYGLVEPMDMIEIRGRHGAGAGDLPILMRGFVSEVTRSESMGSGGQPARSVTIGGQDYGKVWQIMQIVYWADYILGQDYISAFRLFERFGVGFQTVLPVQDFVKQVVEKCINPFLAKMLPDSFPLPRELKLDITVKHGTTSPGIQSHQGTFFELLRQFCDVGPWNEMFLEDRQDGVYLVFRPAPFLTAADDPPKKIQADAPDPVYVDVTAEDLVSINASRSDQNVSNYYWVRAPRFDLVDNWITQSWAATGSSRDTVILADYTNSQEKLYGTRVMQAETALGNDAEQTLNTGAKSDGVERQARNMVDWVNTRRKVLVDANKDNVLFERGSLRLRGNEAIKPGTYVRLTRGTVSALYYAMDVQHELVPFFGWTTTVSYDRGTGFVRRVQHGGSPYLSELA